MDDDICVGACKSAYHQTIKLTRRPVTNAVLPDKSIGIVLHPFGHIESCANLGVKKRYWKLFMFNHSAYTVIWTPNRYR